MLLEDALPEKRKPRGVWGMNTTMLTVCLSFVLFRADTLTGAGQVYWEMFTGFWPTVESTALFSAMGTPLVWWTLLACVLCCGAPGLALKLRLRGEFAEGRHAGGAGLAAVWEAASYAGAFLLLGLCVMNLAGSDFNPFIYFRF